MIQLLAALAILRQDDLKKGMNSSYSSYCPGTIYPIIQIVLVQKCDKYQSHSNSIVCIRAYLQPEKRSSFCNINDTYHKQEAKKLENLLVSSVGFKI